MTGRSIAPLCLRHSYGYVKCARHWFLRGDDQVSAAAARVHSARVARLVITEQALQIDLDRRVRDGVGQNRFPAAHALVHRCRQCTEVARYNRAEAVLAALTETADPRAIELPDAERAVPARPLVDRDHVDHRFQPARNPRIAV